MKLKTGKINNIERKFIPVKKSKFEKYINNLVFVEEYKITQYYFEDYKYRKFEADEIKYTKSKKVGDYTNIEEITENEFLENRNNSSIIVKHRKKYKDNYYTVEIDYFEKPNKMIMIEVSSDLADLENYSLDESFIEVTNNPIFNNNNIIKGSIKKSDVIIEGTDGVGKSTTIKKLLKDGIICQDRCEDVISKNMMFDISMDKRASEIYKNYFERNKDTIIVFLINSDKSEINRRINQREKISKFDIDAFEYGVLYKETYEYIMKKYDTKNRFIMIDCTGLSIDEQYEKIKKRLIKLKLPKLKEEERI